MFRTVSLPVYIDCRLDRILVTPATDDADDFASPNQLRCYGRFAKSLRC